MDKLPLSILNQIFLQLHLLEKIQCMLVCHNWARIIETYTLYHTIKLIKWEKLQQLLEIVQQDPSRGKQVKKLMLRYINNGEQEIDPNLIIDLLPNLRLFEMSLYVNKRPIVKQIQQQRQINIKHILESFGCFFTSQILSTSLCPRLKSLSVTENIVSRGSIRILFNLLVNAPALSDLYMTGFITTFDDLELLHTNLPHISSIILREPELKYGDSFSTADIQPALSVFKFVLDSLSVSITDFSNWIRYISKKYTKLTEIGITCERFLGVSPEDQERISKNELPSLIQGFGPQLKILLLNISGFTLNYFKIFENANFKMQSFSINMDMQQEAIPDIILLDRLRYIQTLKLSFRKLDNLEWLRELESLKELELNCTTMRLKIDGILLKKPFRLNQILDMCADTLDSLKISCHPISVDSSDTRQYPIKHLYLIHVPLPRNFDSFISSSLSKLKSLVFHKCGLKGTRFNLPHHHLLSVEINEVRTFNMLLLETENSRYWYAATRWTYKSPDLNNLIEENEGTVYQSTYPRPYDSWNGVPSMVFSCASVRSLMVTR